MKQKLLADPLSLRAFVLQHCVSGHQFSKEFTNHLSLISHLREELNFTVNPDGIFVNEAKIVLPDVCAGNGVIHLIDSVLKSSRYPDTDTVLDEVLGEIPNIQCITNEITTTEATTTETEPEETTTETATETTTEVTTPIPSLTEAIEDEGIDTFIHWLNESGYLDSIQDGGEYTIFVPTDEAIAMLPPTLRSVIEKQPRKLKKTLKHHIVPSLLDLDQIPDETTVPSLLPGKNIRINKYQDNLITASGAPTGKRIKVGNIQFVKIDKVLEPPTNDLYSAISKSSLLKKIAKLIDVASLQDELKDGGPYTFYAPSKKAFKKITPEVYDALLEDPLAAKEFVLRHLVRGAQYSSGIKDGSISITENGNLLDFSNDKTMMVNDASVTFSDINATNGVLHIIDDIL